MNPLFSFGVVADVQYGDKPNSDIEGYWKYYREAPGKLESAVKDWKANKAALSFVMSVGDIVEGVKGDVAQSTHDLELVAAIFDGLGDDFKVHHVVGNHCLSATRETLLQRLGIPDSYHSTVVHKDGDCAWRVIVLDTTEMSLHSKYPEGSPQMKETLEFRDSHPVSILPNCCKRINWQ